MDETIYGPILTGGIGALLGWLLVRACKEGTSFVGSLSVDRAERPFLFWVAMVFNALMITAMAWATIVQILWPGRIQI